MPKTIYNKLEKSAISDLPVIQFEGRINVILSASEAERAVNYLLSRPILGFDTETRPSFQKGHLHKVSLLQVATTDECFLFRLNLTGLTPAIIRLLQDNEVVKVGLSWHDDLNSLHRLKPFEPGSFIDIQDMVRQIGIEDLGLQKIYANLFGQKISKRQQLTNWEADVLSDKQKRYAATDAWACVMIYNEINNLVNSGNYTLVVNDRNEENISEKE